MRAVRLVALTLACTLSWVAPGAAEPTDADADALYGSGVFWRDNSYSSGYGGCAYGTYYAALSSSTLLSSRGPGWLELGLCVSTDPASTSSCDSYARMTGSGVLYRGAEELEVTHVALRYPAVSWGLGRQFTLVARYRDVATGETGSLQLSLLLQGSGGTCRFWQGDEYMNASMQGWTVSAVAD